LTPAGHLSEWSEADFIRAMRTGVEPGGERLSQVMPFQSISAMTDEELKAVWLFLQSLPPVETGSN
ncbi:MAG: cytochrome C, partial [Caldilineae bacterium]